MTVAKNRMCGTKSKFLVLMHLLVTLSLAFAGCQGDNSASPSSGAEGPAAAPPEILAALTAITEDTKLTASDAAVADRFGISVAISGNTAVVGSFLDDDGGFASGSAYVFQRSGITWSQQAKLTASDPAINDQFGFVVAISGNTVVVGALLDDDGGFASGSAYVFVRSGTTWSQQAKLTASDPAPFDQFGQRVAISGNTVVVGVPGDGDAGSSSGSAYVFERSGTTWSQQAKLTAGDAAAGDNFGSVAISGNTVLVGAGLDDDGGNGSGSAYVFQRSGTTWSEETKLTASDAAAGDDFGVSVAISGNTALVGTAFDDDGGSDSGSAYVFVRNGTTWSEQAKLTAGDAAAGDQFGFSVAISGNTALVGARLDDDGGFDSGSTYLFDIVLEPALTPFAAFAIEEAEVELKEDGEEIEVEGRFVLGAASDGFDLLTEDVTVIFDGFSETIPAGSFVRDDDDDGICFEFAGGETGLTEVEICADGRFEVEGEGLNLIGIDFANPVPFSLQIGNDLGGTEIPFIADGDDEFEFKVDGDDDDDDDDEEDD